MRDAESNAQRQGQLAHEVDGRILYVLRYGYSVHNYYLAILVEMGIVGIFYFVLLGISFWRRTWANIRFAQKPAMLALWKGIFAVNVGVLFFSIPIETLDSDIVAKALFFVWSMRYLRDYLVVDDYDYEFNGQNAYDYDPYVELS